MIPFFCCVKDKQRLLRMNKMAYVISYLPLLPVISTVFLAMNLILMPFAYLKTLIHKMNLVCKGKIPFTKCLLYLAIGLPLLLAA